MDAVTIRVKGEGLTLERLVFKQLGAWVPGAVEATLDANRGLSALPDELPVGTVVAIPQPSEADAEQAITPIRLVD